MRRPMGISPLAWLLFFLGGATVVSITVNPEAAKYAATGAGIIAMLGALILARRG